MSSSTDFLLALENVTVSFDGFKAVNALNLYIDKDELRVIIGPNGAGKTTVLDLICGRTKVSEGSIKFKDQEITGLKEHEIVRRGIGRKFQTPSIYEDLTVFENLEISVPRGRDVAGALFWKRTDEVIETRARDRRDDLSRRAARPARRDAQPRPETVAGDRHAADPGPGALDARRAGGRHERLGARQDRGTARTRPRAAPSSSSSTT